MKKDLTQLEIPRLPETFNLTDGHAHRPLTASEEAIANDIFKQFFTVEREQQPELERGYVDAFYGLTRQTIDYDKTKYLFLPSASISLEIVGNFLRLKKYSLALTEPCFDNLANIFKRHDVGLTPIPDDCLESENFGGILETLDVDAICIVSPNNPTGNSYTRQNFELLVEHCKATGKLLILDTSFRAYRPDDTIFDEYGILQQSGIDYIVVEDTGKTWPTKELKTSVLAVSPSVYNGIFDIYSDFIYHHSPFVLQLLTSFIKVSQGDGLASVHGVVETNKAELSRALEGSILKLVSKPFSSVAWLEVPAESGYRAEDIVAHLAKAGIFVLPGTYFYWSDKSKGDNYIRVSLVRDAEIFARAAKIIHDTCKQLA
ncbi:MAG TPA: pyridoxal phosphate-dependent aminotransferase [Candidatus Saccharimonadales bacterium]|nr:pyridoxal phosphate-dependent aminotransferase [Candidatus Saccharimonadales bacterium]